MIETALSDWLGISRTPVREALRRLQLEGLLEHAPGGGVQVTRFDLDAITELYKIRETLEGTAAQLAATHATGHEIRMLLGSIERQKALPRESQIHARENIIFHEMLHRSAHNRFLLKSLQSLQDSLLLLGPTTLDTPEWIEKAIGQHAEIVNAISKRDETAAEAAAREHIRRGYENRVATVLRNTEGP